MLGKIQEIANVAAQICNDIRKNRMQYVLNIQNVSSILADWHQLRLHSAYVLPAFSRTM